jgi:glutathione S-transferase
MDRFFDDYGMTPMQKVVLDALRGADERDPRGVAEAHEMLETAYRWLEQRTG